MSAGPPANRHRSALAAFSFRRNSVMTFKHKLSNRLALLRDIVLAGTVALAACEVPSRTSLDEAVSKVIVSPETLVVSSNQTTDFVAVALTAAGDTVSSGITWTATAGSVTDAMTGNGVHKGHYSAPSSPGQYKVKAKANSGSAADSATVTVTSVAVASVSVSPATAAIWIGAAQQFTAATMDSAGEIGRASCREREWMSLVAV